MKSFLFFASLLPLAGLAGAVSACRGQQPAEAASALLDSAVPSTGRSQFDELVARLGGTVPYPFKRMRTTVMATDKLVVQSVLIPYSRSLQADHVSLAKPRILLIVTGHGRDTRLDKEVRFPDIPMFIAFSEEAQALEVLSFNDQLGRYEFQIVSNYAEGMTPLVQYANRSLCKQCHQSEGPIFPAAQWEETNLSASNVVAMRNAVGQLSYQGFKLQTVSFNRMQDADFTASRSVSTLNALRLIDRCGRGAGAAACRRTLMTLYLSNVARFLPDDAGFTDVGLYSGPQFEKRMRDAVNDLLGSSGVDLHSHRIPKREPTPAAPATMTPEQDPKAPRKPERLKRGNNAWSVVRGVMSTGLPLHLDDRLYLRVWAQGKFQKIIELLEAPKVAAVLAGDTFSWAGFWQAIGEDTSGSEVTRRSGFPDTVMPAEPDQPPTPPPGGVTLNGVGLFKHYCADCHSGNGDATLDFMDAASAAALRDKLRGNAEVRRRLDWDAVPASEQMPPPASRYGRALKDKPAHRAAMQALLVE